MQLNKHTLKSSQRSQNIPGCRITIYVVPIAAGIQLKHLVITFNQINITEGVQIQSKQVDHFIYHLRLIYISVIPSVSLFPFLIERPWQGTPAANSLINTMPDV